MFGLQNYKMNDLNTFKVFQCILKKGPLTKKEIQVHTDYSWGGVCNSISRLLKSDSVTQKKHSKNSTPGRIPYYFNINYEENLLVGIDVTLGRITGVISHLNGECAYCKTHLLESNLSEEVIEALFDMLEDLFKNVDNPSYVKAIGLAFPGSTVANWAMKKLEHPFQGVFPTNLQEIIEKHYGVMTEIFHDPDCLLVVEINNMYIDLIQENILGLRWSNGMGLSMLISGKIYHGSDGMAGEIGHTVIDPKGRKCSCGKNGCLETYASVHSLLKQLKDAVETGKCKSIEKTTPITFEILLKAYLEEDPFVVNLMEEALDKTSMALANAINIINPSLVIISGEFSRIPEEKFKYLRNKIEQHMMIGLETKILQSDLDDNAAAMGAALLMRERVYFEKIDPK